jgi:hypothetical protein
MFGVVLPVSLAALILLRIVPAVNVVVDIGISVDINIDIAAAAVPVAAAPRIPPSGSYCHPDSKG